VRPYDCQTTSLGLQVFNLMSVCWVGYHHVSSVGIRPSEMCFEESFNKFPIQLLLEFTAEIIGNRDN
jgi:hypothetical protein